MNVFFLRELLLVVLDRSTGTLNTKLPKNSPLDFELNCQKLSNMNVLSDKLNSSWQPYAQASPQPIFISRRLRFIPKLSVNWSPLWDFTVLTFFFHSSGHLSLLLVNVLEQPGTSKIISKVSHNIQFHKFLTITQDIINHSFRIRWKVFRVGVRIKNRWFYKLQENLDNTSKYLELKIIPLESKSSFSLISFIVGLTEFWLFSGVGGIIVHGERIEQSCCCALFNQVWFTLISSIVGLTEPWLFTGVAGIMVHEVCIEPSFSSSSFNKFSNERNALK